MELRLSRPRRWLFRHTLLPRILATGKFPAGARAPRETRPRTDSPSSAASLQALTEQADVFIQSLSERACAGRVRLTHAYFGPMSARQALRLVTVHTRHHADQLAQVTES
jgi:DinB superfamily